MEESREAQEISVEMPEQVLDALLGGLDSLSIDRYIYFVYIYRDRKAHRCTSMFILYISMC